MYLVLKIFGMCVPVCKCINGEEASFAGGRENVRKNRKEGRAEKNVINWREER